MAGQSGRTVYDHPEWRYCQAAVHSRDGWRCCKCGRMGGTQVDHIVPLAEGGPPFDLANLQLLCKHCHREKTARDCRISTARGRLNLLSEPWPVDAAEQDEIIFRAFPDEPARREWQAYLENWSNDDEEVPKARPASV